MRLIAVIVLVFCMAACQKVNLESCPLIMSNEETINMQELPDDYQKLLLTAIDSLDNSYAPYSHFHVAAAILSADSQIITANNVENAAYGSTICAERAAIFKANAEQKRDLRAIAITAKVRSENGQLTNISEPVAPCGACRQVIYEFAEISNHDIDVIMSNSDGSRVRLRKISELLPYAFGPKAVLEGK